MRVSSLKFGRGFELYTRKPVMFAADLELRGEDVTLLGHQCPRFSRLTASCLNSFVTFRRDNRDSILHSMKNES